jgi:hypothetical protein
MPDPHPRPSGLAVAAHPDRRGFLLVLLARLLPPARSGGFGAGYALRCRQEANRARLACPACRASARRGTGGDSRGITEERRPRRSAWPAARWPDTTHRGTTAP